MFSSTRHLCRVFGCPPGLRPSTPRSSSRTSTHRAIAPFALPRHGPRKEEPPFTDGRFDALASCLVERLRVREGGLVGALSAPKADDPQEDLVHRSERGGVFRTESPRNTPVQQDSITSAFNMQAFRLIGAVFLSYNSGPNRLNHVHMRLVRRSISSQRSAFSCVWMCPKCDIGRRMYFIIRHARSTI